MVTSTVVRTKRKLSVQDEPNITDLINCASVKFGDILALCLPFMALTVVLIVLLRYVFDTGAIAAQELVQYLHACVFMLGAAVTLEADRHVRVDVFYRQFNARQKAWVNTIGHIIFTLPLCCLIGFGSAMYVSSSWSTLESSAEPGGLPFLYLLKSLIPIMAILLALQATSLILSGIRVLCEVNNS